MTLGDSTCRLQSLGKGIRSSWGSSTFILLPLSSIPYIELRLSKIKHGKPSTHVMSSLSDTCGLEYHNIISRLKEKTFRKLRVLGNGFRETQGTLHNHSHSHSGLENNQAFYYHPHRSSGYYQVYLLQKHQILNPKHYLLLSKSAST